MHRVIFAATFLSCATVFPALADPWKDESGHGWRGGEYKEEYWDGRCKIERKWEKDGDKEERKCDGRPVALVPMPLYTGAAPGIIDLPAPPPGREYGPVYRDAQGLYCREYQGVAMIGGRQERIYGAACLQPDGSWSVAD